MTLQKLAAIVFFALLINAAYIGAFAEPSIFYMGNVLLHLALGVLAVILGIRYLSNPYWAVAAVVFATGAFLAWSGAILLNRKVLWAHIAVGLILALLAGLHFPKPRTATLFLIIGGIGLLFRPQHEKRIVNPTVIPVSIEGEGDRPSIQYWPSSSRTNDAGQRVLTIDPEDVQAYYTLMLAYRGLGDTASADREQKLFQRCKAVESAQAITPTRRLICHEDNNERQMIHDRESPQ